MACAASSFLKDFHVHLDEELDLERSIGRGCFGAVYNVKVNGVVCVAKRVHSILTGANGQEGVSEEQWRTLTDKFCQECILLSRFSHPNVVQFMGVHQATDDPRDLTLVMEKLFMNLTDMIVAYQGTNVSQSVKLHILRDITSGLLHVHSLGVVHRDLNAGNILLTQSLHAKVADFGASRVIDSVYKSHVPQAGNMTAVPGAPDYMPPEALPPNPVYGFKLDVFSFGHLALYLVNWKYPQLAGVTMKETRLHDTEAFCGLTVGMEALKRLAWLHAMGEGHPLGSLVAHCLQDEPRGRPSMSNVNKQLATLCQVSPPSAEEVALLTQESPYEIIEDEELPPLPNTLPPTLDTFPPPIPKKKLSQFSTRAPSYSQSAGDKNPRLNRINSCEPVAPKLTRKQKPISATSPVATAPPIGYSWYHCNLSREAAEAKIKKYKLDGTYIIRDSTSTPDDYSLTLVYDAQIKHIRIPRLDDGRYILGDATEGEIVYPFNTVAELVSYYQQEPLTLRSAGRKIKLKYECPA